MKEDREEKELLPLEKLMLKYIPVGEFPERYGISVAKVMSLINSGIVRKAEFKVPGLRGRVLHVNYEEVLSAIEKEKSL